MSQAQWAKNNNYATVYNIGVQSDQDENCPSYSSLNSQEIPLSLKHIFALVPYTMPLFWRRPYIYIWHGPNINVSERNVSSPRHSGRDAFSRAIIFLLWSVTQFDAKNNCFSIEKASEN